MIDLRFNYPVLDSQPYLLQQALASLPPNETYLRMEPLGGVQAGFYMHPMSQALQEYAEMDVLRGRYEQLTKVAAPQKIQMVVRVGRAEEPYFTYR